MSQLFPKGDLRRKWKGYHIHFYLSEHIPPQNKPLIWLHIHFKGQEGEIELRKFHEERGKIKCECYSCEQAKKDREEMTERFGKFYEEPKPEKIECGECKKLVALSSFNEETGACKKCVKEFGL